jgi:hypothetical protein
VEEHFNDKLPRISPDDLDLYLVPLIVAVYNTMEARSKHVECSSEKYSGRGQEFNCHLQTPSVPNHSDAN